MTPSVWLVDSRASHCSVSGSPVTTETAIRQPSAVAASSAPRMISTAHGLRSWNTRSIRQDRPARRGAA